VGWRTILGTVLQEKKEEWRHFTQQELELVATFEAAKRMKGMYNWEIGKLK
jgi:hypothetical protein